MQYLIIAGSSAAVYVILVVAIRLFGKKEFSQLSTFDIVFILLISNAVQNAMTSANLTFWGGLCSAATLFTVNYIFRYMMHKFPKISKLLQGEPVMLLYNGKIIADHMKKAQISVAELEEAAREHGVGDLGEVTMAVLEVDGSISIVSDAYLKSYKRKRRRFSNSI